uniref:Uncharacterized protein n=1 Tax=Cannabis sativa TaxID=3483 RepID=A0A803NND5_CANSA
MGGSGRGRTLRFCALVVFIFLLSFSVVRETEARALNAKWAGPPWRTTKPPGFLDRFTIRLMKHSGPSPGGPGHRS